VDRQALQRAHRIGQMNRDKWRRVHECQTFGDIKRKDEKMDERSDDEEKNIINREKSMNVTYLNKLLLVSYNLISIHFVGYIFVAQSTSLYY
jgi:hypothetical protein